MKAVQFASHGVPGEVVETVDVDEPTPPEGDEVLVEVLASAINPADLLILEDRYPGPESLPAGAGIEGCGDVVAVGPEVTGLKQGDRVMIMGRENWTQMVKAPEAGFIKLPDGFDPLKGAQMKANPMTALLMLTDYVELQPGDWVIQNAANSAVGRHVIRLAESMGVKTVNVVRREALVDELKAEGADLVVVDGDDLAKRVRAEIGEEARVRLAFDAIAGKASERLADCLSDGGTVVNYGFISGEPCMITPYHTVIHDIRLRGFWLAGFFRRGETDKLRENYAKLAELFENDTLRVPVEATYPIEEAPKAVAHAHQEARHGKILFLPNGPLD